MLVKTNQKDKNGKDLGIYQNALTGEKGTLAMLRVPPSMRHEKRHPSSIIPKVKTNRKTTNGRRIYFQIVNIIVGTKEKTIIKKRRTNPITIKKKVNIVEPTGKQIKHVQETSSGIQRKTAMFNLMEKIELNKSKWHNAHPEYQRKE